MKGEVEQPGDVEIVDGMGRNAVVSEYLAQLVVEWMQRSMGQQPLDLLVAESAPSVAPRLER